MPFWFFSILNFREGKIKIAKCARTLNQKSKIPHLTQAVWLLFFHRILFCFFFALFPSGLTVKRPLFSQLIDVPFHDLGDRPSLVLFLLNGNRTNSLNFLSSGDTSDELVFLPQNMGTFCVKARKNVGLFLDSSTVINKLLASRSPCGIFLRIVKFPSNWRCFEVCLILYMALLRNVIH